MDGEHTPPPHTEPRLAELMAALSLATDLGMGQPMEHGLRSCLLAIRLGDTLGLTESQLGEVYYVALLRRIGCTSDSYELGRLFGDDLAAHARVFTIDFSRPLEVVTDMLRHAGAGRSFSHRVRTIASALAAGPGVPDMLFRSSCEVAQGLAEQLGFGGDVLKALGQTFERWDGRGFPGRVKGEDITLAARLVQIVEDAEVFHRLGGIDSAVAVARERAGHAYDPALAERFGREARQLFHGLESESLWETVLASEPGPRHVLGSERLGNALLAIAQFADLKSPYTAGHSIGVAELASRAVKQAGLPMADVLTTRQAALLHDLGRAAVPNGIWDKQGPLTAGDWEQVRLHPYYTERVLARADWLARLGSLAGLHHERLDGSGYHRGARASMLSPAARILAAADAYHAMTEPRPHRAALTSQQAADELRAEVRAGHLDGEAVAAVLRAAGGARGAGARRRREWPAGLSPREVEVLRLLARGLSNREIAARIVISEPTVAAHVRHIYDKIGATTRAGATLFAMRHALLDPDSLAEK